MGENSRRPGFWKHTARTLSGGNPSRERLESALGIERRLVEAESSNRGDTATDKCLDDAFAALERGDLDSGWKHLHAARRARVREMDLADVALLRIELLAEAGSGKLGRWRASAVEKLLGPVAREGEETPLEDLRLRVRRAMEIRDEHSDNIHFKNRLTRQQVVVASLWAALLLGGLLVLFDRVSFDLDGKADFEGTATLVLVLLLGALGASLSTLRGLSQMAPDTKIPERVGSRALTSLRPLVGAVAAVALYVLFASGLFSLGGQTLGALLTASIVAGFSERFVTGLLERVADKGSKSEPS